MAEMYARRVIRGEMGIEDVPAPWRDEVRKLVEYTDD